MFDALEYYGRISIEAFKSRMEEEHLMFSDFIKHYSIIRSILRDVFLYGCFSREGLEDKRKVSSRKVSYEMRRIQQYVEQEFIRFDKDGRYKLLSLTYDYIKNTENFLVKTYMTKSFTRTDVMLYFNLLMAVCSFKGACCFRDIEDKLIAEGLLSYDGISSKTVERKLEEMCSSLGILDCRSVKRTRYYSVSEDMLRDFSTEELVELHTAVALFRNIIFPVTAGYFCEQTLMDYMAYERRMDYRDKDCFQYRGLHFHPVIEEEILWQLLQVIHEKRYVQFNYKIPDYKGRSKEKEYLKPYKVRYDIQCGRFYVVSFGSRNRCIISRLDRIESIEVSEYIYNADELEKLYEAQMKYSWSSVPLGGSREPETVIIQISVDESREAYIIEKISGEADGGVMEHIGNGAYQLTMQVNDSLEMVPWIRSYAGYMKVIKGHALAKRLQDDWKEMLTNYGVV